MFSIALSETKQYKLDENNVPENGPSRALVSNDTIFKVICLYKVKLKETKKEVTMNRT